VDKQSLHVSYSRDAGATAA